MTSRRLGVAITFGVLAACARSEQPTAAVNAATAAESESPGYAAPPELTAVASGPQGDLELSGVAAPGAAIRLAAPSGPAAFATADGDGRWRVGVPAAGEPRLFSLSMNDRGRTIQAVGYLFVAPSGRAARLRAGGGSEVLDSTGPALTALAIDYDAPKLAATLAGRGAPGQTVSLRVDGLERGQAGVDPRGRFVLPLGQLSAAGEHDFDLASQQAEVEFHADISAPAALGGAPFVARPAGAGWRIDWLTPGGGEQTTLVLGPPERSQ